MTTIAGVNMAERVRSAFQGKLPPMSLRRDGDNFLGIGVVDGDTATFIPDSLALRPNLGDLLNYEGSTRVVNAVLGTNDAWTLTLGDEEVPALDDPSEFAFSVESIGAGRVLMLRTGAGRAKVQGQWRNGDGPWFGFSMEGRSLVVETGAGEIEVVAYRVDDQGRSTEPVNEKVTAT